MSYILDALKRAESERSRGAVPNIHAQPEPGGNNDPRRPGVRLWVIALTVATFMLLAAAAWWSLGDKPTTWNSAGVAADVQAPELSTPPFVPRPELPVQKPPASVDLVPNAPPDERKPTVAAHEPSPVQRDPAASAGVAAVASPIRNPSATAVPPKVSAASERLRKVELDASASAAAAPTSAPASASTSAVAVSIEERIYSLKELPDDIRNSLPALVVGGATYSENAASRMLIVNGNLFREGDKLTPEVTLQQIKLRTAVLSFRGYRYFINY